MSIETSIELPSASVGSPKARQYSRPPVIVLNLFYSGVGIARDLAQKNIRVVGLSSSHAAYGTACRWCEVKICPDSQDAPEEFFEFLMSLREELRGAVVFATRDADVDVLNRHREILNEHFILAIPPRECLDLVVNKQKLATLAMDAGVPTAKTLTVRNERDLLDVSTKVGFPCVVKPVLAMHWRGTGKWKQVGARKAFRVDSYEELLSEYLTVSSVHPDVLVQEWIPGPQTNLLIVGGYVGADSRLLGHFTARKILQSPEDFGTGCIVQSEPLPELLAPTEVLFQKLNYRGMAEVEFKQDASTGALRLIEINTRHWDQHRLGSASGLNLTWLAYQDAIGEPVGRCSLPTKTCKWIGEDAFLLHVATGLWRREVKVKAVWDWLQGTKHYALLDKHDLKPFLKSMSSVIAGLLRSAFLKLTPRKRNLS